MFCCTGIVRGGYFMTCDHVVDGVQAGRTCASDTKFVLFSFAQKHENFGIVTAGGGPVRPTTVPDAFPGIRTDYIHDSARQCLAILARHTTRTTTVLGQRPQRRLGAARQCSSTPKGRERQGLATPGTYATPRRAGGSEAGQQTPHWGTSARAQPPNPTSKAPRPGITSIAPRLVTG